VTTFRPATTVVAVLTYRRVGLLPPLLGELVAQAADLERPAAVLVVDNDPEAGARETVQEWSDRGVRYVHEPRPGISAARNRALDESADADVLVFIDDDELPSPGWLSHLARAWRAWGCAAVAGPVPPRFGGPVDPWVAGSGVFDRPQRPTGMRLQGAGAGNLLLDLRQVRSLGVRFDEATGLTGGEDTLFTHELVHRGAEIRWCAEAEAVESVPEQRLTRAWVRQRSFRSGCSWSAAEVQLAGSAAARTRLRIAVAGKAAAKVVQSAVALVVALLSGDVPARGRAVCTVASYAGLVFGAFGYVRAEYARASRPARTPSSPPVPVDPTEAAA
jgi:hypothetical protein